MKLVVGLGNPDRKYGETRHNVGFMVLAELAARYGSDRPKSKFHSQLMEVRIGGEKVFLQSPLTYMNRSGVAVSESFRFYQIDVCDLLIVCDDLNLPLARLRMRSKGSAGGQKGLADIICRIGTNEFSRLRIGIGSPPPGWDASDYVLGKFAEDERPEIDRAIKKAADAIECWVNEGSSEAMNRFNNNE